MTSPERAPEPKDEARRADAAPAPAAARGTGRVGGPSAGAPSGRADDPVPVRRDILQGLVRAKDAGGSEANTARLLRHRLRREAERGFDAALVARVPRPLAVRTFVVLNVLAFVATTIVGEAALGTTDAIRCGASFGPYTAVDQPWRLVTAAFIHWNILHLGVNLWALLQVGAIVERIHGTRDTAILWICSCIAGSAASLIPYATTAVSAGASGGILGIYGALAAVLLGQRGLIPPGRLKRLTWVTSAVLGFTLLRGGRDSSSDLAAHAGGAAAGFLASLALLRATPLAQPPVPASWRKVALVVGGTVAVAAGAIGVVRDRCLAVRASSDARSGDEERGRGLRELLDEAATAEQAMDWAAVEDAGTRLLAFERLADAGRVMRALARMERGDGAGVLADVGDPASMKLNGAVLASAYLLGGLVRLEQGDADGAERHATGAAASFRGDPGAHVLRGAARLLRGDDRGAEVLFRDAALMAAASPAPPAERRAGILTCPAAGAAWGWIVEIRRGGAAPGGMSAEPRGHRWSDLFAAIRLKRTPGTDPAALVALREKWRSLRAPECELAMLERLLPQDVRDLVR